MIKKKHLLKHKMHKRPIPRRLWLVPTEFVTVTRENGALAGEWRPKVSSVRVPSGTPGRVGEIVDAMRRGTDHIKIGDKKPWSPPIDYEFVARYMRTEDEKEIYLKRCREWCEAHPPIPPSQRVQKPKVNIELAIAMQEKYKGKAPPIEERIKLLRASGFSEEYISKKIERMKALREEAIDDDPDPPKPPKPKGKAIKAVKKRT